MNHRKEITLKISTTTGKNFDIKIDENGLVDELRWQVARKVQTPRDRLTLIHKENVLKTGRLKDHGICDGSRLTLLPNVESGFSVRSATQGTEHSVVQAIESLSDQQIDDFLSGRDPLTLALRVEDHMMFIQLQLEQQFKDKSRKSFRHRTQIGPNPKHRTSSSSSSKSCPDQKSKQNSQNRARQLMKNAAERLNPAQPCVILHNQEHKIPAELNDLIMATEQERKNPSKPVNFPINGHLPTSTSRLTPPPSAMSPSTSPALPGTSSSAANAMQQSITQPNPTSKPPKPQLQPNQNSASNNPNQKSSLNRKTENKKISKEEKAYIDSITAHGQGLFSGTFSGSLHPSIQDYHGKPRRDPQTILQILRDLLSATNQQQFIPQILRGGNGIIVGGQGRLRGSSSKSTSTKSTSTSSLTKISKTHRVSKGGSSSRSSRMSKSDTKPPKQITPQYVEWLKRVNTENEATRSKMAKLQEALRERKNKRKNRASDQFRNSIKDDNINPEVHNLQSLVHNIETVQCPTPMQTDDDSQMKLSDCLTV